MISNRFRFRFTLLPALAMLVALAVTPDVRAQDSEARQWNDMLLESIRKDFARPTVHARNLYHVSAAMWDAWATYDPSARTIFLAEDHQTTSPSVDEWRSEALSHATYQILKFRFASSPGFGVMLPQYQQLMTDLGYDFTDISTVGDSPSAVGNRIALAVLTAGTLDNANEANDYINQFYEPINEPLLPALPGNPDIFSPNRWQPLALDFFIDQSGNPIIGGFPEFLGPEWGQVTSFSLSDDDRTIYNRDGFDYWVFHDPGPPPYAFNGSATLEDYQWGFALVSIWSSHLGIGDNVMIDASPASIGNITLTPDPADYDQFYDLYNGGDNSAGHTLNPITGQPYATQMVPRADYGRILAEFWADGPDSETPPGHWFTILNYVSDELAEKRMGGTGPILSDLEWDVKGYLAMAGGMHDVAIAAWGIKGWYDYIRPVSAIRWLADRGQSTDLLAGNYHPLGIPLHPGYIETVTLATTAGGQKHEHLAGEEGKIAVLAWRGPDYIVDPDVDDAGVGWILAENWWPYQRPTFVTPPFAGYISGHSTYSRAAAHIMTNLTGSAYFPGGLGTFEAPQNEFLVFEEGPSMNVTLQWATYFDAADQCSLSRIWGGIHPPADDIPGRLIGNVIGPDAFDEAQSLWDGPWEDLGSSLDGVYGAPQLVGTGTLEDGDPITINLTNAREVSTAYLVVGFQTLNLPLYCGTLVPDYASPNGLFVTLATNGVGELPIANTWPSGVPSGFELILQYWINDPASLCGLSASNAIKGTTP
jgi:hypothetical protein